MQTMWCECGRLVQVSDECISVKCHHCCHNAIAKQLQEEKEEQPEKKRVTKKKAKKYFCDKYKVKKSRITIKCRSCEKKSGCELWSLKNGKK